MTDMGGAGFNPDKYKNEKLTAHKCAGQGHYMSATG